MPRQQAIIKGPIVDMDNMFNKVFPSFSLFNYEFLTGNRLIDVFSNYFSFHSLNRKKITMLRVNYSNFIVLLFKHYQILTQSLL